MKQQYTGIPTVYKGYRFRSRLEATWAAWFDMLRWTWEYEPFDCNGWIPDFALLGNDEHRRRQPVLVEVKPITQWSSAIEAKIDSANKTHEILLLGISPIWNNNGLGHIGRISLGWMRENMRWGPAIMIGINNRQNNAGFTSQFGSFHDRITETKTGWLWLSDSKKSLEKSWASARNATQWSGK